MIYVVYDLSGDVGFSCSWRPDYDGKAWLCPRNDSLDLSRGKADSINFR